MASDSNNALNAVSGIYFLLLDLYDVTESGRPKYSLTVSTEAPSTGYSNLMFVRGSRSEERWLKQSAPSSPQLTRGGGKISVAAAKPPGI